MSWRASLSRYVHEVRIRLCQHSRLQRRSQVSTGRDYRMDHLTRAKTPL